MKLDILIISYKSLSKLSNCLNNLGNERKILIVENSNNLKIKNAITKKYHNCKIIFNGSNLGFSKACNIGIKNIYNQYVLILNTDTNIKYHHIKKLENEISDLNKNFAVASPISDDMINFMNNKFDPFLKNIKLTKNSKQSYTEVEMVKAHSLIINLKQFKDKNIFDENFFFFFEEIDLCRRIKEQSKKIFIFNKVKIRHESAGSINQKYRTKYNDFRNSNFYLTIFYYFKKHHGYFISLIKHSRKLVKFFLNIIIFYLFSDIKYRKNKFRFLGLWYSIIGRPSSESAKILDKINI